MHNLSIYDAFTTPQLFRNLFGKFMLSLSFSGFHSSDSEGHFDTPEAATPVRAPPTFPGELENNNADPDKTGETTAE